MQQKHQRSFSTASSIASTATASTKALGGIQMMLESLLSEDGQISDVQAISIAQDSYKSVENYKNLLSFLFKGSSSSSSSGRAASQLGSEGIDLIASLRLLEPYHSLDQSASSGRDFSPISVSKWQRYKSVTTGSIYSGSCWSRVVHYYRKRAPAATGPGGYFANRLKAVTSSSSAAKVLVTEHQYLHLVGNKECRFYSLISDRSFLEFDIVHQIYVYDSGNQSCCIESSFYLDTQGHSHAQQGLPPITTNYNHLLYQNYPSPRAETATRLCRSLLLAFHNQLQIQLNVWLSKRQQRQQQRRTSYQNQHAPLSGSREMMWDSRRGTSNCTPLPSPDNFAVLTSAKSEPNLAATVFKSLSSTRTGSLSDLKDLNQQPPALPKRTSTARIKTRLSSTSSSSSPSGGGKSGSTGLKTPVASTSTSPKPESVVEENERAQDILDRDERPKEIPEPALPQTPPPGIHIEATTPTTLTPRRNYADTKSASSADTKNPAVSSLVALSLVDHSQRTQPSTSSLAHTSGNSGKGGKRRRMRSNVPSLSNVNLPPVPGGLDASHSTSPAAALPSCLYILFYFTHFFIVLLLLLINLRFTDDLNYRII